MKKQTLGKIKLNTKIWFSTGQERFVWFDKASKMFLVNKFPNGEMRFKSMAEVEQFVKSNGYKFV